MRRIRRLTIIRIGLAVATLAMTLPVAAQAKPIPRDPIQAEYQARAAPVIDTQRVDGASSFDVNQYAVTGFGLALALMAGGLGYAIRHNRRSTLSPA
jgi:cytochrome oxidase assembly protein ShyY1